MNKADNYYGFIRSCRFGHIEMVKYLWETFKDPEMNKINDYYGFTKACEYGYVKIV